MAAGQEEWSTLHVSNIPLDATRWQLEEVFSEIGPLKKCFVVKGKEKSKSTVGFVTFAMREDCLSALKSALHLGDNDLKLRLAPDSKQSQPMQQQDNSSKGARSNPKKGRLIIRNLSFKATEDSIRETFGKYGELAEINILKKPNGQMVGCAFVQYKKSNHAAKAILEANAKPFLGRPVAVDWAVPKEVFKEANPKPDVDEPTAVKEEQEADEDDKKDVNIKEEEEVDEEEEEEVDEEEEEEKDEEEEEDEDKDDQDDDDDEEYDNEDEEESENKGAPKPTHSHAPGHDVDEGKTVFIKNLAYETDEEDLRDMMAETFGPVYFAKLVLDKVMQHPRGTGFVKFKSKEDAAKCVEISEGTDGVYLDNRRLTICLAIKKGEVEQRQKERKEKEAKDSRNLYLAREGIIREGTKAAEGVSAADLAKRKELEQYKKNMLKNLNMFVSSTRLCIRNLPASMDDTGLRRLVARFIPKEAKITEARVMRDMTRKQTGGQAASKEFGFVSLSRHEHALLALRNLNNNPEVFGADRRPIVDFSIENRQALLARQKREEKSKANNPNFKGEKATSNILARYKDTDRKAGIKLDKRPEYAGTLADPKVKTLPRHTGEKVRHAQRKISRKDLRKQEQERKNPKKRKLRTAESSDTKRGEETAPSAKKQRVNQQKKASTEVKMKQENKDFDLLVNKYRNQFASNHTVVKKWFDT